MPLRCLSLPEEHCIIHPVEDYLPKWGNFRQQQLQQHIVIVQQHVRIWFPEIVFISERFIFFDKKKASDKIRGFDIFL